MNNISINARIIHKNDTEQNWNKCLDFIPKKGQIIIYNADSNRTAPRIKIGDGSAYLIDLPFYQEDIIDQHINNNNIHTNVIQKLKWNKKLNCEINQNQTLIFLTD